MPAAQPAAVKEAAEPDEDRSIEYNVRRPVYNYAVFNATHGEAVRRNRPLLSLAKEAALRKCGNREAALELARKLVPPPLEMLRLRQYSMSDLASDVIAGLTMCVFHIPQGLAYGMLAGLRPVNGLYTSLIPVIVFAIFGRSRHLSIGTFAVMSLLLLDMVEDNYEAYLPRIEAGNSSFVVPFNLTDVQYAKLQTAMVGSFAASLIMIAVGLLRLGFFMRYVSDAMLKGFTTAAGVHVLMSQLPSIFGIKVPRTASRFKIIGTLINLFKVIKFTNLVTIAISAACCAVLYLVKEIVGPILSKKTKMPVPIELILIVILLLASKFGGFNENFGVAIVGEVPPGLPAPLVPDLGFLPTVFPSAIPVGLVGGAVTMSLAKLYCLQFQYSYDFNEDFVIFGAGNLLSSFFQCFFSCGALARNAVVVSVGMKSQIACFVSCACMLLVLLAVGPLFYSVPTCVLGSIILMVSLLNVIKQATELPQIWRISRIDFSVWIVSAFAVLLLDVTMGLAIGFAFTLFSVILRTQSPRIAILGQVAGTDIYKNVLVYSAATELPGVKIVRFDAPLNFANAERFRDFCVKLGARLKAEEAVTDCDQVSVHTVVLDCSSWVYADMVGVRTIKETYSALRRQGYRILFAACKESVRLHFFLEGFFKEVDKSLFFLSLHDAVLFAVGVVPGTAKSPAEAVDGSKTTPETVIMLAPDCAETGKNDTVEDRTSTKL